MNIWIQVCLRSWNGPAVTESCLTWIRLTLALFISVVELDLLIAKRAIDGPFERLYIYSYQ